MQNEPNFKIGKMNVTSCGERDYERMDTWSIGKNEPKTNPNEPNFKKAKMNANSLLTKAYENQPPMGNKSNQTQCRNSSKSEARRKAAVLKVRRYREIQSPSFAFLAFTQSWLSLYVVYCPACPDRRLEPVQHRFGHWHGWLKKRFFSIDQLYFATNRCSLSSYTQVRGGQTFLKFCSPSCRYQYCKITLGLRRDLGHTQDIVVSRSQTGIWMLSFVAGGTR